MASSSTSCSSLFRPAHLTGLGRRPFTSSTIGKSYVSLNSNPSRRLLFSTPSKPGRQIQSTWSSTRHLTPSAAILNAEHSQPDPTFPGADLHLGTWMVAADIDPATAKVAIGVLGPFLSAFAFLFIVRIVMSWYPKLPVGKFPYVVAYAPTEPILAVTRKVIPPLAGVDVTPVVWFGLVSFLNEILVGPQGLLVLISQQVNR
ncbi:unnamed protein product [Linum tenue]|uniref:Protein COFACTOR ASSEMBLY OF COMPLEX C SUBUNIT B CCB3, chloroplastic n=1 Tax=Linum tenue TaxID=586396 RepID=A0AAV0K363_9ROSI|nr:unnamed protein product [Linum tenue]CAI0416223.1 unnamed protein product [Linum tenue]